MLLLNTLQMIYVMKFNTIENRIYLIGNIDIYWYYLIGNIDIANIDYEVSISLSLVLLHAYFIATYWIWKSMRQVCSRSIWDMNIHDEESAADLQQTLHHTERVCGQVCSKSAADLLQTLHHSERVCSKSAASLRQTCRRLFIILKEYAASLRQTCCRLFIILKEYAASLRQVCGRPAADSSSYWKSMRQVCGKSAAKLICMWKRWLSAAGLLQICGKSAAGVCGRLISFLWGALGFCGREKWDGMLRSDTKGHEEIWTVCIHYAPAVDRWKGDVYTVDLFYCHFFTDHKDMDQW